jgi:hypothetical protein
MHSAFSRLAICFMREAMPSPPERRFRRRRIRGRWRANGGMKSSASRCELKHVLEGYARVRFLIAEPVALCRCTSCCNIAFTQIVGGEHRRAHTPLRVVR